MKLPYVYISFARKDGDLALGLIRLMEENGFRVRYGAGDDEREFKAVIAKRILESHAVLALVSPNFSRSHECYCELSCALSMEKPFFPVMLEDFVPPERLTSRIETFSWLRYYGYPTPSDFVKHLLTLSPLDSCRRTEHPEFEIEDGVLIRYHKNETAVTVPDGVRAIGQFAFSHCDKIESVTLPETVEAIGEGAFWRCYALQKITLPSLLLTLGRSVFSECRSLRAVAIPELVESISTNAFWGCTALESVIFPEGLRAIGEDAFAYCLKLSEIVLPESLEAVFPHAFSGCRALGTVRLPKTATLYEKAFPEATALLFS